MPINLLSTRRPREFDEDALRNLAGFLDVLVQMDLEQKEGKRNESK